MTPPRATLGELLSRREDARLEFKRAAALEDDLTIPRAVCSFLNATGGTVLVGIGDDGTVEGVPEPEAARRRIEDRLESTITPPGGGYDIQIETLAGGNRAVLRIDIRRGRGDRGVLYAVTSSKGRFLVPLRQGDRTVVLPWSDIDRRLRDKKVPEPGPSRDEARKRLIAWETNCERDSPGLGRFGGLYLVIQIALDERIQDLRDRLALAHRDPSKLGVGSGECSFADEHGDVRIGKKRFESGHPAEGWRWLQVSADDPLELCFATRLDEVWTWGSTLEEKRAGRLLHPHALSQTVSSCAQLAAVLVDNNVAAGSRVCGALDLRRLRGRKLPPGPPQPYGYVESPQWPKLVDDPGPVEAEMEAEAFEAAPHAFAKLLLEELYAAFGWRREDVPFYDASRERFVYS